MSVLSAVQLLVAKITQTSTNNKGRYPNNIYVEGLNNPESWIVNNSRDKITIDGQYCYWFPKNNTKEKFYGMYINHPSKNNYEWAE